MGKAGAVLLVLVIGGAGFAVTHASASEDDAQPRWSVAGELSRARSYARAAEVETGEILIVGGLDPHDEKVTIPTTELFDPRSGATRVLAQTVVGRLNQRVTPAWGGRVVVTGGTIRVEDRWESVATVDVFLPWSRTWLRGSKMLQPRSDHGAVALSDGRVLVTGGNYNNRLLRSSEIYDPATNEWAAVAPLPKPRTQFSMAVLPDGSVLVAGGFQDDGQPTTSTLIYLPFADRWAAGPDLLEPRLNHSMVSLADGDLLFFGGERSGAGTSELYEWRSRRFVRAGVLGEPRLVAQGAAMDDGAVIAVGGLPDDRFRTKFDPLAAAEMWDPRRLIWRDIQSAPTSRAYAQLIATDHGIVRLSGVGMDEDPMLGIEVLSWR
jgi:galactose oxidase-like protein